MGAVQPRNHAEFKEALGLLIARPGLAPADVNGQIDSLLRYADTRDLSLEHCLMAERDGRIIAACLCVDSPGRTSSVFIPSAVPDPAVAEAVIVLLDEATARARRRNVQILQSLVPPESTGEAEAYARARFELLAQLIYLESDLTRPVFPCEPTPPVIWETYRPETHALFARVVEGTYEGSLDCGNLNDVRDIEDILASHRATGAFDPRFWLVGLANDQPVGAILLARVPERALYEVVYMGLLPGWRGRGYGAALLRRGVQIAREQAMPALSLAVDVRNTPARSLYQRFGFVEVSRRDVWIRRL